MVVLEDLESKPQRSPASEPSTLRAESQRGDDIHPEKKKLRIVIITENFFPKVDGITLCLGRLLAHLRKVGHEVVVLGPDSGLNEYETHKLVGTFGFPNIWYPELKFNFIRPRFLRTIKDFNPDVIHVVEPYWLGLQMLIAMELGWCGPKWQASMNPGWGKGVGGAVMCSYHTNISIYVAMYMHPWTEAWMWNVRRWLHEKCILTSCPSQSTKDILQKQGFEAHKLRIWPSGVDLSLFGPRTRARSRREKWLRCVLANDGRGIQEEGTVIAYVGRISREKNLPMLISAFDLLLRDLPPSTPKPKLVFVGDGPFRPHLQKMCLDKGMDVAFEGYQSGAALAECFASADIFAFPSSTETFGQVVLEALASGLPVVGLDAEGTRDLVTHNQTGLLLSKPRGYELLEWHHIFAEAPDLYLESMREYAELLKKLVLVGEVRKEMGKNAVEGCVSGHGWEDSMESLVGQYREAISLSEESESAARTLPPKIRVRYSWSRILRGSLAFSVLTAFLMMFTRLQWWQEQKMVSAPLSVDASSFMSEQL